MPGDLSEQNPKTAVDLGANCKYSQFQNVENITEITGTVEVEAKCGFN